PRPSRPGPPTDEAPRPDLRASSLATPAPSARRVPRLSRSLREITGEIGSPVVEFVGPARAVAHVSSTEGVWHERTDDVAGEGRREASGGAGVGEHGAAPGPR